MVDFREDTKWTVYIHIIPKSLSCCNNDKYYVGITSKEPKIRWGHNGYGYKGQKFYEEIKNLNWDEIIHYIVATNITEQEAKNFERILIKKLNSTNTKYGYNVGKGGNANEGWHHNQKTIEKLKLRSKGGNNPQAKTLYQFSLNGDFINQYSCAADAAISINMKFSSKDNITAAARNYKKCNGFLWAYENNIIMDKNKNIRLKEYKYNPVKKPRGGVKTYQFDLKTKKFIAKYDKIADANRATNIPSVNIKAAMSNRVSSAGGYIWRYECDIIEKDNIISIKNLNKQVDLSAGNEVYLFSKNGTFFKKIKSQKLAAKFVNGSNSSIGKAIKNGKLYKNYYYKSKEQIIERDGSFFIA